MYTQRPERYARSERHIQVTQKDRENLPLRVKNTDLKRKNNIKFLTVSTSRHSPT